MHFRGIAAFVLFAQASATESSAGPAPTEASQPAPGAAEGEAPGAAGDASAADVDVRSVGTLRGQLESDMAELGRLANDARKDENIGRAACVLQREERAKEVMELATGELLVLQDDAATAQQRKFAAEKLAAAADRLHKLVEEAKACRGELAPEDQDDDTKTDMGATQTIPVADPTVGPPSNQPQLPPPPVDDTRPPSVASPTF
jgi:hypothetical protein